jgi:SAM-dependent methyltransferase
MDDIAPDGESRVTAAPPGGRLLGAAKLAAERVLWTRVAVQRRLERTERPLPVPVPGSATLQTTAEMLAATREVRRLRLPSHHDRQKNWDALGALATIVRRVPRDAPVLDAGSARYSSALPWLRLYSFTDLTGINIEFSGTTWRDGVRFEYGDVAATGFPTSHFGAVTCLSVIEHGVPVEEFLREMSRILRPGGLLVLSTDFDADPPDTTGLTAYGQPVHIYSPPEIDQLVAMAARHHLRLPDPPELTHPERPVTWRRYGLRYTFIRLTFEREG